MSAAYYNEIDPYAAQWLRNLIDAGLIPRGEVDTRSIVDVGADDLVGFSQCHFFAGIGGWALAARLAGWPDDRELWTGSCPCQPFSVAGKGAGQADERHLWPEQFRLIRDRRPAVWLGEQVAAAVGKHWLDGVLADLEGIGYAGRAVIVPACAVDAPHRRDRAWVVADRGGVVDHGDDARLEGFAGNDGAASGRAQQDRPASAAGCGGVLEHTDIACEGERRQQRGGQLLRAGGDPQGGACGLADADLIAGRQGSAIERWSDTGSDAQPRAGLGRDGGFWGRHAWVIGHDGKARRVEPSIRLLAHGVSARVGRLRAYGNAIVPQVAAEVIAAYMHCAPIKAAA